MEISFIFTTFTLVNQMIMTMLKRDLLKQIDTLRSELTAQAKEIDSKIKELDSKKEELETNTIKLEDSQAACDVLDSKVKALLYDILWLRRQIFGRKAERFIPEDPSRLGFDFEGLEVLPQEQEVYDQSVVEVEAYTRKPKESKKGAVRLPLPEHLERVEEVIEPKGVDLSNAVQIGQEVTEVLEYIPGKLFVRRIIRPKYSLGEDKGLCIADLPSLPLPKSNAGASLLAHLLVSKYVDHLPFHRQLQIFKRENMRMAPSTVNDWFLSSTSLLTPLYDKLKEITLESDYIGVDESTIPVVDNEKHKTIKAYMWVVRDNINNLALFHYDKGSRSHRTLINLLGGYKGTIQSDGYGAYSLYENKKDILLLGCMAHCRRKFEEALTNDHSRASKALEQIGMLYTIERMADDDGLSFEDRAALRKRLAYPILVVFEKWLEENIGKTLPKSKIGKAISYAHTIYRRLSRYVLDGRYRLDNNLVENIIRPLALGRKQYLFCQTHESAQKAAVVYSLMACCKLHGVNPMVWLTDILSRIDEKGINVESLLPHRWKNGHEAFTEGCDISIVKK